MICLVLVIAEKNIVARRIAQILSGGKYKRSKIYGLPFYYFYRNGERYIVFGLRGHILDYDFPREYKKWRISQIETLLEVPLRVVEKEKKYVAALKSLGRNESKVIIATDYDREGELIGVEAIYVIKQVNPRIEVYRAKFSSLTPEEIRKAFSNLTKINMGLAEAADARRIIDLLWGATLTRYFTLLGKSDRVYSLGRVQTPTLWVIVQREKEIKSFVPKPYFEIVADLSKGIKAEHSKNPFFDEKQAKEILERIKGEKEAIVSSVFKEKVKRNPPHPLDTTTFLSLAASKGFSVSRAMKLAEDLYRNGYISYPRTDNTVYPDSLKVVEIAKKVARGEYQKYLKIILSQEKIVPTRGKKKSTDHPPIHPVDYLPPGKMSKDHERIYDIIMRRFLATLAPPSLYERVKAEILIGGEKFIAKGSRRIFGGWEEIEKPEKEEKESWIEVQEGEKLEVIEVKMLRKKTRPPRRYTQSSLIKEMERLGIGTKSTRHEIIKKLFDRGYVKGRYIRPTDLGMKVIELAERFARDITSVELTRKLEREMDEIEGRKREKKEVIEEAKTALKGVLNIIKENRRQIEAELKQFKQVDRERG